MELEKAMFKQAGVKRSSDMHSRCRRYPLGIDTVVPLDLIEMIRNHTEMWNDFYSYCVWEK